MKEGKSMFTDTHCHISDKDNIEELLIKSKINGVIKMINNGCDKKSNEEVLKISEKYKEIYAAIGIHPQNLENFRYDDLKQIEKNIEKIVAIGEIGLDYYNGFENREFQKEIFRSQLDLASKYDKPVIIHSRNATEDTIKILKEYPKVKGSIHCFSGSLETAKIYIKMGYKLGINGVITFKNSKLWRVIENIPLEYILLETDSPYLTPEPFRGKKNDPSNVKYIAEKIASIKDISIQKLSEITEKNTRELFDI